MSKRRNGNPTPTAILKLQASATGWKILGASKKQAQNALKREHSNIVIAMPAFAFADLRITKGHNDFVLSQQASRDSWAVKTLFRKLQLQSDPLP